jgi:L-amino acid N-acyltransferase YncA
MTVDDLDLVAEDWQRALYRDMLVKKLGPAFVIEDEEGVVCLGGAVIIWPGVAEAWLRLIRVSHAISLIKELRRLMLVGAKHFKLWRIQACIESKFEKGCKFAEFMGLEREGLLKKHSYQGKDNIMYARLF